MSVDFYGTQEEVLTFEAGAVTAGYPVAMSGNKQVGNAENGTPPVGIALHVRNGYAAVRIKGYAELPYSGTQPTLGRQAYVADGSGGVRLAEPEENGLLCLTVQVDPTSKTMGLYL